MATTTRQRIIAFFKENPSVVRFVWSSSRFFLKIWGWFVPVQPKTMLFCSFGGRKFDDSPKAIYEEVCNRKEFEDWSLIWAFVNPELHDIPRGIKIKVDTMTFFKTLLRSRVWVSNSGMDRGIGLQRKSNIRVETWHGTPLKKICGEEHQNSISGKQNIKYKGKPDADTIRCAQSAYDKKILARVMHSVEDAFLLCDLPRNDGLLKYGPEQIATIKENLQIPNGKKILLYMPTYREYLINNNHDTFIAPPIDMDKWEKTIGKDYILLIRAHYAVSASLGIKNTCFVKDVSDYPFVNDLYIIADVLLTDYSSAYFDFSILDRPMLCFAYDIKEYEEKRGLYLNLEETLPCSIDYDEDSLLNHIVSLNYKEASERTRAFHYKYAPIAGHASTAVVDKILSMLHKK